MSSSLYLPLASPLGGDPAQSEQAKVDNFYGTDLIYADGLTVASGDYQLITGLANLRKSIYRRLMTRPGEYRLRPGYGVGVGDWVKLEASPANIAKLKNRIVEELIKDRRIQAVSVTDVTKTDSMLTVTISVTAFGRSFTFQPFGFEA